MITSNGCYVESSKERRERVAQRILNTTHIPLPVSFFTRNRESRVLEPEIILDRISVATNNSKIVVFKSDKGLDCCFRNTVAGDMITDYVGIYSKHDMKKAEKEIYKELSTYYN